MRWSCERAQQFLEEEEQRRRGLEQKAVAAAAFTLAVASYYAKEVASPSALSWPCVIDDVVALLCAVGTLLWAFLTVSVSGYKAFRLEMLRGDEVLEKESALACGDVLEQLCDTLEINRKSVDLKAGFAAKAQQWALFATTAFVVTILVEAFSK